MLCLYSVSAKDSPAPLASEQGGAQLQPCLGADTVPAAVAIGNKTKGRTVQVMSS